MLPGVCAAMSFWKREADGEAPSSLRVVDLSNAAAPFRYIGWANYLLFLLGAIAVRQGLIGLFSGGPMTKSCVLVAAGAFSAWSVWKHVTVAAIVRGWGTMVSLLLLGATVTLFAAGILAAMLEQKLSGSGSVAAIAMLLLFSLIAPLCAMAIFALLRVKMKRIPMLDIKLRKLLKAPAFHPAYGGKRPSAQAPLKGMLYIGGAAILVVGGPVFNNLVSDISDRRLPVLPTLAGGFAMLVMARQFFRPDFDQIMETDQRAPVLYLRSFADDVQLQERNFLKTIGQLLDFSLESRLAEHFFQFGPFIAIGAPSDPRNGLEGKTHMGAARVQLSDEEWQAAVIRWMDESAAIVCMAGWSSWVEWEMRTILARGHTHKLLLVFPESNLRGQSLAYDLEDRMNRIRAAFQGSIWEPALAALDKPKQLRCLTLGADGEVTAVLSRSRTRNAYELGALVGHAVMLGFLPQTAAARGPCR
jgi:hypothetical protein